MDDNRINRLESARARAAAGDAAALDELLLHSVEVVQARAAALMPGQFRYLMGRGHDPGSVVSVVWMSLRRQFQQRVPPDSRALMGLLHLAVRNALMDLVRAVRVRDRREAQFPADLSTGPALEPADGDSADPGRLAQYAERQEQIQRRLGGLTDEERQVFEHVHFLNLSQARVADLLGIHPRTVNRLWISSSEAVTQGWV